MEKPFISGAVREREGMSGLEELEGMCIADVAQSIAQIRNIPLLRLDANHQSVAEELSQARSFISRI